MKKTVIAGHPLSGHLLSVVICFLDGRLSRHQNVSVRGRLITIVIALAVLAFAEIGHDDPAAPTAHHQSNAAAGQLADPPAPEPDIPATIIAAVNASATVLVGESSRQLRPALSVFTVSPRPPVVADSTDKPRFFPLLI